MAAEDPEVFAVDGIYAPLFDDPVILEERTTPTAEANKAILFAKDNGSGKTQLMVLFPTGSAIQLAIEA